MRPLQLYLLLEDGGRLQARHDVLKQTTGGRVELQLSARHDIRVHQLEDKHRNLVEPVFVATQTYLYKVSFKQLLCLLQQ